MTNTAPYGRPEAARASMKADFDFIIDRIIGKHRTVTLVQVVAVRDENGSGEPDAGCVDLKPLVMAKDHTASSTPTARSITCLFFVCKAAATRSLLIRMWAISALP